jgi:hypothetical protein
LPQPIWSGTRYVSYSVLGWGTRALVALEKVEHVLVYAYLDGKSWSRGALYAGTQEAHHRPVLARDEHGVGWVFWSNTTRGHTFFSRWLGSRFSAPYECRALPGDPAPHDGPAGGPALGAFHTAQKEMRPGAGVLGVALAGSDAEGAVYFDRVVVPRLSPEAGRKVLFLDMLEVGEVDGLVESFHPMKKHPANPVLRTGPTGSFDDLRAHAYGEVLYDQGKFRMWYTAWSSRGAIDPESARHYAGYAESQDGVTWTKPALNQVEFNGSKANSILDLDYQGTNAYMPMVVRDTRESDPNRRYKLVIEQRRGNTLHFSADGVRWSSAGTVNPRTLPGGAQRNPEYWGDRRNLFYDTLEKDPARRWKVYSHCSMLTDFVRKTCLSTSPDLFRWTPDPRNPIMHPRAGLEVEQHLTSVWPHAGMYVGMFDIWDPVQQMPEQLIASRDGINFVHVFDGRPVIEKGKPGEWDAGWISPANVPLEVKDELWYYYSGSATTIAPVKEWFATPMFTGLATIRRDGFVSLDVAGGRTSGSFATIRWTSTGSPIRLELNAEGLSGGSGRIRVELAGDGGVVASSEPVTADGVAVPVVWRGADSRIPAGRTLQLRFRLEGSARLYSFTFR